MIADQDRRIADQSGQDFARVAVPRIPKVGAVISVEAQWHSGGLGRRNGCQRQVRPRWTQRGSYTRQVQQTRAIESTGKIHGVTARSGESASRSVVSHPTADRSRRRLEEIED